MTHDELMSALNVGITMTSNRLATHEEDAFMYRKALRKVVELHKPEETQAKSVFWCKVCMGHDEMDGTYRLFYPCPTIQAIEKELK